MGSGGFGAREMNYIRKDVEHGFNLSGLNIGDWFMGCRICRFQLPARSVGANQCKHCLRGLGQFTVTEKDLMIEASKSRGYTK